MLLKSERKLTVAIDGPAGSGKSTVAKMVAKGLGLRYVDSGAVYRALTWKVLQAGVKLDDISTIIKIALELDLKFKDNKVFVDSNNITLAIREPRIDKAISDVCQIKEVRSQVVNFLQELGRKGGLVMEGRDITTVVFPNAEIKIYLDATSKERALRRWKEFKQRGIDVDLLKIQEDIERRDDRDKSRSTGPLTQDKNAFYIDTTGLNPKEVALLIQKQARVILSNNIPNYLYYITLILSKILLKVFFKLKITNQENIPLTGGVLIAANHMSYVDPLALGVALPRPAHPIAKEYLFKNPLFGWLLRRVNAHPIKEQGVDKAIFKEVYQLVLSGKVVIIFPEGERSRNGTLQEGRHGIGLMVSMIKAKYPNLVIIPAKIIGTDVILPRGAKWFKLAPLEVRFGKPIDLTPFEIQRSKKTYQEITEAIMEGIKRA